MENEIKLSVIVPVYNVEKYIGRCVRSLMEQTLKDGVEFIFIDDASPDSSMTILGNVVERYPERKGQVRIIHNPRNLGIFEVRKRGIEEANGEYIGWCDSDDWCESNMFEYMLNKAYDGKYDIVVCDYLVHMIEGGEGWRVYINAAKTPRQAIIDLRKETIPTVLWAQCSKKQLIKEAIQKVIPVSFGEDIWTILHAFLILDNNGSVYWTRKAFYHYNCIVEHSLSKIFPKKEWKIQKKNIAEISAELKKRYNSSEIKTTVNLIKLRFKRSYREIFDGLWDYWSEYKEAYKDICLIDRTYKNKRWKVYLVYNFYLFYWLYFRKTGGRLEY